MALSLQYLQVDFFDADKHKSFLHVHTNNFSELGQPRPMYPQKTSFQYLLQYLKKAEINEVDFLPADKNQSFLQVDTTIFDGHGLEWPKFLK